MQNSKLIKKKIDKAELSKKFTKFNLKFQISYK